MKFYKLCQNVNKNHLEKLIPESRQTATKKIYYDIDKAESKK